MKKLRFLIILFTLALVPSSSIAHEKPVLAENCYMSPCKLNGDFDGDGKMDQVVLIQGKDKKKGLSFIFSNKKKYTVGAGTLLGAAGDNFYYAKKWLVLKKGTSVGQGGGDTTLPESVPHPKGDYLSIQNNDEIGGIIYWNGSKFEWYQQGD